MQAAGDGLGVAAEGEGLAHLVVAESPGAESERHDASQRDS